MSVVDQYGNILRENTNKGLFVGIDKNKIIKSEPLVINIAHNYRCLKYNSSAGKDGFLGLFGQLLCDNKKCENSKPKFKKL